MPKDIFNLQTGLEGSHGNRCIVTVGAIDIITVVRRGESEQPKYHLLEHGGEDYRE